MDIIKKIQNNFFTGFFVVSFAAFVISQLFINSILAPLGTELQNLSTEKNYLVEENREMEEEIAKSNSIVIIQELASNGLNLSSTSSKTVVYLDDTNLVATR